MGCIESKPEMHSKMAIDSFQSDSLWDSFLKDQPCNRLELWDIRAKVTYLNTHGIEPLWASLKIEIHRIQRYNPFDTLTWQNEQEKQAYPNILYTFSNDNQLKDSSQMHDVEHFRIPQTPTKPHKHSSDEQEKTFQRNKPRKPLRALKRASEAYVPESGNTGDTHESRHGVFINTHTHMDKCMSSSCAMIKERLELLLAKEASEEINQAEIVDLKGKLKESCRVYIWDQKQGFDLVINVGWRKSLYLT